MIIKGWASVFEEIDHHSDIVVKGCFEKDLENYTYIRPMLLNHDDNKVIGKWDVIKEKEYGLWCEGTVLDKDAQFWIKENCLSGLSIGYRDIKIRRVNNIHYLDLIELEEISITAVPINRVCRITVIEDGKTN